MLTNRSSTLNATLSPSRLPIPRSTLRPASLTLMCHPGLADEVARKPTIFDLEAELNRLTSPVPFPFFLPPRGMLDELGPDGTRFERAGVRDSLVPLPMPDMSSPSADLEVAPGFSPLWGPLIRVNPRCDCRWTGAPPT